MNEINKALLAPCGLYCGLCRIYIAYKDNDIEFKKEILPSLNSYGVKTVNEITCTGCLSKGIVFHFCQKCPIKDCAKNKNFDGCFQCDDFPCTIIANWPDYLEKKIMIRAIPSWRRLGTEKWIEAEEKRYKCPNCGTQLFHRASECITCHSNVDLD